MSWVYFFLFCILNNCLIPLSLAVLGAVRTDDGTIKVRYNIKSHRQRKRIYTLNDWIEVEVNSYMESLVIFNIVYILVLRVLKIVQRKKRLVDSFF